MKSNINRYINSGHNCSVRKNEYVRKSRHFERDVRRLNA